MIRTCGERLAWLPLVFFAAFACAEPHSSRVGLQLLMFEDPDCSFCAQWESEVGGIYARTQEGRAAPLVRTPLGGGDLPGITLRERVRFTPTFVLLRDGIEVGRITGYPGEAHFWGLLDGLLQRSTSG